MNKVWSDKSWEEYLDWSDKDRKIFKRINALIKDIERNGLKEGIGKPEPLKHNLSGFWSREIDGKNRLVHWFNERGELEIVKCKGHHGDH